MEAHTSGPAGGPTARTDGGTGTGIRHTVQRLTTETKQAFKTTEFWLTVAVIVGILVSAAQVKGGDEDEFIASQAWLYVAILTGLYAVGRGLAKSGSRDPYDADADRH